MAVWQDKVAQRNALHDEWLKTLDYLVINGKSKEVRERAKVLADGLLASHSLKSQDLKHKLRLAVKQFISVNK